MEDNKWDKYIEERTDGCQNGTNNNFVSVRNSQEWFHFVKEFGVVCVIEHHVVYVVAMFVIFFEEPQAFVDIGLNIFDLRGDGRVVIFLEELEGFLS